MTGRVMIASYRRVYLDDESRLYVQESDSDDVFEATMIVERVMRHTKRPDEYDVHVYGRVELPQKRGVRRGKAYFGEPKWQPWSADPQPISELPHDVAAYCIGKEAMLRTLLAEGDVPEGV